MDNTQRLYNSALSCFRIHVPEDRYYFRKHCYIDVEKWAKHNGIPYSARTLAIQVNNAYKAYVDEINKEEIQ